MGRVRRWTAKLRVSRKICNPAVGAREWEGAIIAAQADRSEDGASGFHVNIYPFDLVAAVAVGWGLIFLGRLPTQFLRMKFFYRHIGLAGLAWMVVASVSPGSILHFDVLIGLLCLWAWWRWRGDHGLSGRLWLSVASGLGISLGVVLVLAVTPHAFPANLGGEILFLLEVSVGGAVIGLAWVLFVLTRRVATEAEVPVALVLGYGRLLILLTLVRAGVALLRPGGLAWLTLAGHVMVYPGRILHVFVLPVLAWWAWRRIRGRTPSTSGVPLLILGVAGALAEMAAQVQK
jgi:hypothetical protein